MLGEGRGACWERAGVQLGESKGAAGRGPKSMLGEGRGTAGRGLGACWERGLWRRWGDKERKGKNRKKKSKLCLWS